MSSAKFSLLKHRLRNTQKRHSTLSIQAGNVNEGERHSNGLAADGATPSLAPTAAATHPPALRRGRSGGDNDGSMSNGDDVVPSSGRRSSMNGGPSTPQHSSANRQMPSLNRGSSIGAASPSQRQRPSVSGLVIKKTKSPTNIQTTPKGSPTNPTRHITDDGRHSRRPSEFSFVLPPQTPTHDSTSSIGGASEFHLDSDLVGDPLLMTPTAQPTNINSPSRTINQQQAQTPTAMQGRASANHNADNLMHVTVTEFDTNTHLQIHTPLGGLTPALALSSSPRAGPIPFSLPIPSTGSTPPASLTSALGPIIVPGSHSPRLPAPISPRSPPISPRRTTVLRTLAEQSVEFSSTRDQPDELHEPTAIYLHQQRQQPRRPSAISSRRSWAEDSLPAKDGYDDQHDGDFVGVEGDRVDVDHVRVRVRSSRRKSSLRTRCPLFQRLCPDRRAPCWNLEFRFWWDILLACITIYHFITIPLRIGQYEHWSQPARLELWSIFDYPFDALYVIDIILRCTVFIPLDDDFFGASSDMFGEDDAYLFGVDGDDDEDDVMYDAVGEDVDYEDPTHFTIEEEERNESSRTNNQKPTSHTQQHQKQHPQRNGAPKSVGDIGLSASPPTKSASSGKYRIFFIYLKGNFAWDFLASVPLDLIAIHTGINSLPFLRLNRLIRLRRFGLFMEHFPSTIEEFVRVSPAVWRILTIFLTFTLVAHWSACAWCYVGQRALDCTDGIQSCISLESNWLQFDGKETSEFGIRYVRALYGMLSTLFTVGLGDIRPITSEETLVFMFVAILGAILCSRATATIASIFQKYDAPRIEYETRMSELRAYMSGKFLPKELQQRIFDYQQYLWTNSRGMDEKKILESLPTHLRMESLVFLEGDALRKVPFFSYASSGLINSLALVLQPLLFSPDTLIQVKGQCGTDLFLVHKGECGRILEYASSHRIDTKADDAAGTINSTSNTKYRILNVLRSGAYFGELGLFAQHTSSEKGVGGGGVGGVGHPYSIKSLTFIELFKLTRLDFEKVMKLCCNNSLKESQREIDAMYQHQLSHIKSQSKLTKLLGHEFDHASLTTGDGGEGDDDDDPFERQQKKNWWYRHMLPDSKFRLIWSILTTLIVLYWFISLPFRITLMYTPYNMILNSLGETNVVTNHRDDHIGGKPNHTLVVWLIVDTLCDTFMLFDIFLKTTFFSFYRSYEEDSITHVHDDDESSQSSRSPSSSRMVGGSIVGDDSSSQSSRGVNSRPELIFQRYKRSRHFAYDVISSIPIDYVIGATIGWQWWSACRLIRLFRLYVLKSAHHSLQVWLLNRLHMNPDAFRLLTFLTLYVLLMHWCACAWYGVGLLSTAHDEDSWLNHELDPSTEQRAPPHTDDALSMNLIIRNYIRSFYFVVVITTTTAGYKDVLAYSIGETIFASFLMMFLALLYYFSLGVISTMLTQISLSENMFQEKFDTLHTFIQQHMSPIGLEDMKYGSKDLYMKKTYSDGISPKLAHTLKSYYTYLWSRQRGVKEEDILSSLPTSLREEIASALNLEVLQNSMTLFQGCSLIFLKAIMKKFQYQIYLPKEYICRTKDVANEMFILNRGKAVVLSPNETVTYEVLTRNSSYGVALFLMQLRRKASVKTLQYCDVSMLTTHDFQETLLEHPSERQRIFENSIAVRKRYVYEQRSLEKNRKLTKVKQVLAMSFTPTLSNFKTWSPKSKLVRNWEMILLVLTIYHCIMIPLRIAFVEVTPVWVFYIEYVFDILFWFDIYLNHSRFSFYKHDGHLCKDPLKIGERYRVKNMWIDGVAAMPLDLIALFVSRGRGDWLELMAYLRLPRVVRLIRIPEYFKRMRQWVQDADLGIEVNYVRLMELGITCILIAHWIGCGFRYIARMEHGLGNHPTTLTWLHTYQIGHSSFTIQYLASLYWSLSTITVVCFGDIIPVSMWEHVYVTAIAVVCFFLVAALIGNIASLLTHLDASASKLHSKLQRFDEYARRHGLPELLQHRVHQYWIHLHKLHQGVDEEELMADLPRSLQMAVATARYLRYIQHQPYFAFCEPNLLHQLSAALRLEVHIPGDCILAEGDLGRKLYIVKKAQVQLVKKGVSSPSHVRRIRQAAYAQNGMMTPNSGNSPYLGGRRGWMGGRNDPIGMSQLAAQLQSRNSRSSDAHSPVRGSGVRASSRRDTRSASLASMTHQHGRVGLDRINRQPMASKRRGTGTSGVTSMHLGIHSRISHVSGERRDPPSSQVEMSRLSLNSPSAQRSQQRAFDPRGSHSVTIGGAGHPTRTYYGQAGRSLQQTQRMRTSEQQAHDPKEAHMAETGDHKPDRASISSVGSTPSYSLRSILGAAMLHHPSYVQDGIVVPGSPLISGVGVGVSAIVDVNSLNATQHTKSRPANPTVAAPADGAATTPHTEPMCQDPPNVIEPGRSRSQSIQSNATHATSTGIDDSPAILHLEEGSLLGELSFFLPLRRTASIYATTFCTFLTLDRKEFNTIMSSLPHYVTKMRDIARSSLESQAMDHANIRRNFTFHTKKLRQICLDGGGPTKKVVDDRKSSGGEEFQKKIVTRRQQRRHIAWLPGSTFVQMWKLLILCLVVYYLYAIPFRICFFDAFPSMNSDWLIVDYVLDLIFVIDLYLNLRHFGYIDDTLGIGILTSDDISRHYRQRTQFKIDILTIIPIDLFSLAWSTDGRQRFFAQCMLRLSRVLRIGQVFPLVRDLGPLENKVLRIFTRVGIGITDGGVRFGKFLALFLYLAHWLGCLWFVVGFETSKQLGPGFSYSYLNEPQDEEIPFGGRENVSWIMQDGIIDVQQLLHTGVVELDRTGTRIYIRSVYYSVKSLCTLGMADLTVSSGNVGELVFGILLIMVSAVVLAAFVATFETTFHQSDEHGAKFHRQMEYNRSYMKSKKLPKGLQERINLYYSYIWTRSKGLDESHALSNLSSSLRQDVMMYINQDIIEKVQLFQDCEFDFIKSIACVLQAAIFMPEDIILRSGTISHHMYFIKDGIIFMERSGEILLELSSGDFFGEDHLLTSKPSRENYIASTFCNIFTLSRSSYESVIEYYPKYRQLLIWKMNAINQEKERKRREMMTMATKAIGQNQPQQATNNDTPFQSETPSEPFESRLDSRQSLSSVASPPLAPNGSNLGPPPLVGSSVSLESRSPKSPSALVIDVPSPIDFNRSRRGSLQQHRTELERKRQALLAEYDAAGETSNAATILATRVAIGREQMKDSPLGTHHTHLIGAVPLPLASPSVHLPPSTTAANGPVAATVAVDPPLPPLRVHAGRLDAASYFHVDVLVPSFRMSSTRLGTLPSPTTYNNSMHDLEEFTTNPPDHASSAHLHPPSSNATEPPKRISPRLAPRVGFATDLTLSPDPLPPPAIATPFHQPIVFTPMPHSKSTTPYSLQPTPIHTPMHRRIGSETESILGADEPKTVTFHLGRHTPRADAAVTFESYLPSPLPSPTTMNDVPMPRGVTPLTPIIIMQKRHHQWPPNRMTPLAENRRLGGLEDTREEIVDVALDVNTDPDGCDEVVLCPSTPTIAASSAPPPRALSGDHNAIRSEPVRLTIHLPPHRVTYADNRIEELIPSPSGRLSHLTPSIIESALLTHDDESKPDSPTIFRPSESSRIRIHPTVMPMLLRSTSMPERDIVVSVDPSQLHSHDGGSTTDGSAPIDSDPAHSSPAPPTGAPASSSSSSEFVTRPPPRRRARSVDLTSVRSTAESALQRLLSSTGRRVAQHLTRPKKRPDSKQTKRINVNTNLTRNDTNDGKTPHASLHPGGPHTKPSLSAVGVSPLVAPVPSLPLALTPLRSRFGRRHSFNVGIFQSHKPTEPYEQEQTFKSVFDF